MEKDIQKILLSEADIRAGIERVARELTASYTGRDLLVVSVLKGSCIFAADLVRRVPLPLELAFLTASSYRDGTRPGGLDVRFLPERAELEGRNVLVLDDILDTGRTLAALVPEIAALGAAEVRTCVFLDKPTRRAVPFQPDYRCFEVQDQFVVGYGLDYAGRYRNLPFVATLRPEVISSRSAAGLARTP